MQNHTAFHTYQQQLQKHELSLKELLKKKSKLGWIRLFVFCITALVAYKVFLAAGLVGVSVIIAGLAILLYLISVDVNNNQNITNTQALIKVNEEELEALRYHYFERYDGGAYTPAAHDYAGDLDLFGKASLFQWINRCYSDQGKKLLAHNLLHPLCPTQIRQRHQAVQELAPDVDWRQQLQAFAMQTAITADTEQKAVAWTNEKDLHFKNPAWKVAVLIYSLITLGSLILTTLGFIPFSLFTGLFILYFIASVILSRNTVQPYIHLSGIVKEISALYQLVQWVEHKEFQSPFLQNLQEEVKINKEGAAHQIKGLKTILDRFDLRVSVVGVLFFNSFLLWDVRQMIALNEWKKKNKHLLPKWFALVAEFEILNTLSTLHFNQPHWCFPEFTDAHLTCKAKEIGHPLLPDEKRVTNNFDLEGTAKIGLITGSNMAGKSTFLRSLGVNVILAQMGAPVCAKSLTLSPMQLMSSMRITDNLAEDTSTFYAELKKLKAIIEAVNRHKLVFILLDEILRGTNSLDRHKGSKALIVQLIKQKAVAVIATHDIELASLKQQYPHAVENYHFDVQVEGEELFFDYKLKQGVCTSLNASILMKKIGIELQ